MMPSSAPRASAFGFADDDGNGLADRAIAAGEDGVTGYVDTDGDGRRTSTSADTDGDGAADAASALTPKP